MNNPMSRQVFFQVIGIMIILNNCSPNHVGQPEISTSLPTEQVKPLLQNEWIRKQIPGTREYVIDDSSTILISGDPTHTSIFQSTTLYTLSFFTTGDSLSFTATVDSTSTNSSLSSARNGVNKLSPPIVHATVSNTGQISALNTETVSSCQGGVDAVAIRVFELTQSYLKRRITIGDIWMDTVLTASCRGKTLLHQQIIRTYQLLELTQWNQYNVAKIQQTISATTTGTNSNPQSQLTTTGLGTGRTTLYVDIASGFLCASDGYSQSELTITTPRGSYPFTQTVVTHIQVRDHLINKP